MLCIIYRKDLELDASPFSRQPLGFGLTPGPPPDSPGGVTSGI